MRMTSTRWILISINPSKIPPLGEVSKEVASQFTSDNITPRLAQWRTETDDAYRTICAELLEKYKAHQEQLYQKLNDELQALDAEAVRHTSQFEVKQKKCQKEVTDHVDQELGRMRNVCGQE